MTVTETLSKSVIMIRKVKPKEIPIMDTQPSSRITITSLSCGEWDLEGDPSRGDAYNSTWEKVIAAGTVVVSVSRSGRNSC